MKVIEGHGTPSPSRQGRTIIPIGPARNGTRGANSEVQKPALRAFILEVKRAAPILDVIGADVVLTPHGRTFRGLSPFCHETQPSFTVWPETDSWYDFAGGGGRGGDVIAYVQQRDGLTFWEALLKLADEWGVRRPDEDDAAFRASLARAEERRSVRQLLTAAAGYYHQQLPAEIRARDYRNHYGFTDATINELQLGWAPGDLFSHFGDELKVGRDRALQTGLFLFAPGGEVRDFFNRRLVFPYWSRGQVHYFIGRRTEETGPEEWERAKYKKLPTRSPRWSFISETIRNQTFYNEDAAVRAEVILVTEGVTDAISARQAGVACISPVTIRFRKQDHPRLLEVTRRAKRVVICNDSEASGAGENGALETARALFVAGRDVRIAQLPRPAGVDKIDVNDFLKQNRPEAFREVLQKARPYIEHLVQSIPEDTSRAELDEALRPVLELVASTPPAAQQHYLECIEERFGIGKSVSKGMLRRVRDQVQARRRATDAEETDAMRGQVFEGEDHYYALDQGRKLALSSFRIDPTHRIRSDNGEIIMATIVTDTRKTYSGVSFPLSAFHSRRSFLQALTNADMQWTGTDEHVQGVLRLVARHDTPIRRGTETLGYLETEAGPRWVASDVTLSPTGPIEDAVILLPNGSSLSERVRYPEGRADRVRQLAGKVLPELLRLNEAPVVLPVIGWFFATPFKPRLMRLVGHFPILWIWGSPGSGKTSMAGEFWRLFGITDTEAYSATETEFPLIRLLAATNSVPALIDEYKPADMPPHRLNTLHRLLRRVYGGEVEERGRPNLSVVSYRLSAPVCIVGEARTEDLALVDRLVAVSPNRNKLTPGSDYEKAFHRVQAEDLGRLARPYVMWSLGQDAAPAWNVASELTDAALTGIGAQDQVSYRCRDNLQAVVFGLTMFQAFAESMGVTLPDLSFEDAVRSTVSDLMEGDKGAKDQLDLFLESCAALAHNGELQERRHYVFIGDELCLCLRPSWEIYLEHQRRVGQVEDPKGMRAIQRFAKENQERGGYVRATDKTITIAGGGRPRAIAIDFAIASATLDLSGFNVPPPDTHTWGGSR